MSENIVDGRGLSCPEPVMLARETLKKAQKGTVVVLVDSDTARENVFRLATNSGWEAKVEKQPENSYRIELRKQ